MTDSDDDGSADHQVLASEHRAKMLIDSSYTFEIADGTELVRSGRATRVET